jgi:hypothetical protein
LCEAASPKTAKASPKMTQTSVSDNWISNT